MTTSAQFTIWDHQARSSVRRHDELNGIGPFKLYTQDNIRRSFDCANYDGCLTYAARSRWESFTCAGCLKACNSEVVTPEA